MNIELQPELDNKIKQEINSYYRVITQGPQGSLPSFNASKNQILIEIPADIVFNPSLLTLTFTRGDSTTSAASTTNAINKENGMVALRIKGNVIVKEEKSVLEKKKEGPRI